MGIFDKLRNELKSETRNDSTPTGWENMAATEELANNSELEQKRINRQRDKLIGTLLPGNGNPDLSKMTEEPNLGPHDENVVLAKISQGLIGVEDFSKILNGIKGPLTDRNRNFDGAKANAILEGMSSDKHQLKLLSFANDFNVNEHYKNTNISDLEQATSTYENPMQFEAKMRPFMEYLAAHNPEQKVREYEAALDALESNLFGKKYEYYKRSKELVSKSQSIFGAPAKSPLELPSVEPVPPKSEREQTHEQLIKGGSEYQISRAQARSGMRANIGERLPYDESCEDSKFVDLEHGFFGVFDGAGGHVGGRHASSIGAETMSDLMQRNGEPKTPNDLSDWLDEAGRRVVEDPAAGFSTGTLAKVIKRQDGGKAVIFAQVGDSRLYIVHPNGRAELVTKDEGFENKITNALGYENNLGKTCVQAGYRELNDGDKLVLCSDGITGDKGTDLMSEDELGQTVMRAGDTAYAAQMLVNQARKNDDRTAIVVEV